MYTNEMDSYYHFEYNDYYNYAILGSYGKMKLTYKQVIDLERLSYVYDCKDYSFLKDYKDLFKSKFNTNIDVYENSV